MKRRSWIAQSAKRTGAGPHADRRERRQGTRQQCRERAIAEHLGCRVDLDVVREDERGDDA